MKGTAVLYVFMSLMESMDVLTIHGGFPPKEKSDEDFR